MSIVWNGADNKGTDKEITLYHRDVLEAKIFFGEKLVASIGSEFIENNGEDRKRQEKSECGGDQTGL